MPEPKKTPKTTVFHLTLKVPTNKLQHEIEFWRCLGFGRITRPELNKWKGEWLNGNGLWVRLIPVGSENWWKPNDYLISIIPRNGLDEVLKALDRLEFPVSAMWLEDYWGASRIALSTPSHHKIELLERAPSAVWPGPPDTE